MITVETFNTHREASSALNDRTRFLAGGTLLMRDVNYAVPGIEHIVRSLEPLRTIRSEGGSVFIGAAATMLDVINARETAFLAPVARAVGGPAIRNMATVGGNLFAPSPFGDFTTALLALDATIHFADGRHEEIETFLAQRDSGRRIVTAISVVPPLSGSFLFSKISRTKPKGPAILSIAVRLPSGGQEARVAFGAMGPTPLRAKAAEAALSRTRIDEQGIAPVIAVATEGLAPADDALASQWYRRQVAPVHLKRLLLGGQR